MKTGINRKLLLTLGCDVAIFLSVVLLFVLKSGPWKSLFVAAPMGILFLLSEWGKTPAKNKTDSDLTDGEKRSRFCVDVAGFASLTAVVFYRALRKNDGDAWHWAVFELFILAALLLLVASESPQWRLRKEKSADR